tara:strand:+ start:5777 stop:6745 length:969 start_codon:yes stop_codon:yes gene_type:complete
VETKEWVMGTDISGQVGDLSSIAGQVGEQPEDMAVSSTEQILSPIVIRKGGGTGVDFAFQVPEGGEDETGPFGVLSGGFVGPTRSELDPYFSNFLGDSGGSWLAQSDFQMMKNDGVPAIGEGEDLNIRKTESRSDINGAAVVGLRGPLILSGFGTDIADRPVPRSSDSPFTLNQDAAGDRTMWKSGPVNLQWDDERKVWQGGAQIICGVVSGGISAPDSPCDPTTFIMKVFRKNDSELSTCDLQETIRVKNRDPSLEEDAAENAIFCIAVRINYEWIPIWVGCPVAGINPPPDCLDCESGEPPTEGDDPDDPTPENPDVPTP